MVQQVKHAILVRKKRETLKMRLSSECKSHHKNIDFFDIKNQNQPLLMK